MVRNVEMVVVFLVGTRTHWGGPSYLFFKNTTSERGKLGSLKLLDVMW